MARSGCAVTGSPGAFKSVSAGSDSDCTGSR
jgi:hypothetical protein